MPDSENQVTKEQFQKLLDNFDWYYTMTDDPRWYDSGLEEEILIFRLKADNPEFEEMYRQKSNDVLKQNK